MERDRGFSDEWSQIAATAPKVGLFLAICLLGWLLVRAGTRLVTRFTERAGLDRIIDRAGLPRLLHQPAQSVRASGLRVLMGIGLLGVLRIALGVFGPNTAEDTVTDLLALLLRTLLATLVIMIGVGLARVVRTFVTEALRDLAYGRAAGNIVATVLVVAFGKTGLDEVGLATSVTTPVLWAILASLTGVIVVGVGGGLIRPMQIRWEEILEHVEDTAAEARAKWHDRRPTTSPAHAPERPLPPPAVASPRPPIPPPGEGPLSKTGSSERPPPSAVDEPPPPAGRPLPGGPT